MSEKVIKKAVNSKKKEEKEEKPIGVAIESQERLAEILNDSPRLVSLNGTEWEIRSLRVGTQWLICRKCIEVAKVEQASFGDIVKQFSTNIPAVIEVLTLALLNDKRRIFKDGNEHDGYSEEFQSTFDTLMWECKTETFGAIFLETLQLIDVSFFMESHRMLDVFREMTMARKNQTLGQK